MLLNHRTVVPSRVCHCYVTRYYYVLIEGLYKHIFLGKLKGHRAKYFKNLQIKTSDTLKHISISVWCEEFVEYTFFFVKSQEG